MRNPHPEETRSQPHQINFRLAQKVQETSVGVVFPDQTPLAFEINLGLVRAVPLCVAFPGLPLVAHNFVSAASAEIRWA